MSSSRGFEATLIHDVTIIRAGTTTDRYGNVQLDWANATRRPTKGWVSQTGAVGRPGSMEVIIGREAQISGWMIYLRAGEDITGYDHVEWNGTEFEVEGPVNPAYSPRTRKVHHIEARLRDVEG